MRKVAKGQVYEECGKPWRGRFRIKSVYGKYATTNRNTKIAVARLASSKNYKLVN